MKKENKNYRITIRLTKKQRELLDKLVIKNKCNLTDLVIQALLKRYRYF